MSGADENFLPLAQSEQGASLDPLPDEFYMQGPYMVFTAAYHLRRGYCCNSDCRHCPYKDATTDEPQAAS